MTVIGRALRFAFAVLLRALLAIGGAVAAYGATGMFTSRGLQPPNTIVLAGLAMLGVGVVVLVLSEHRLEGIWSALLLPAIAYSLYAFGSWSVAECPPDHPPITSTYSCSVVGTHIIAIVAPIIALLGLVLFISDIRALARRERTAAANL